MNNIITVLVKKIKNNFWHLVVLSILIIIVNLLINILQTLEQIREEGIKVINTEKGLPGLPKLPKILP